MTKTPRGYRMLARGSAGEIFLYGVIGVDFFGQGISAKQFADDLRALGSVSTIDLRINSEGGSVTDARAIHTLLRQHRAKITTHIDGIAASAASFVALAGDEVEIAEGGFFMIHNAHATGHGTAEDLRAMANTLDLVNGTMVETYRSRTNKSSAQIKKWMDAETWFTGREAVQQGFADRIVEDMRVAACLTGRHRFKNVPAALRRPRLAEARALIGSRLRAGVSTAEVREFIRRTPTA